jgi:proline dehydrogenase
MPSFENTRIAFSDKTTSQLRKAYRLFLLVKSPNLVRIGSWFLDAAVKMNFPLRWALNKTVFAHFCGGETLEESVNTIESFGKYNIRSIMDYAAEGAQTEKEFDEARDRILATIELARENKNIGFAVFKFTGLGRFDLFEKASIQLYLKPTEQREFQRIINRAYAICQLAYDYNVPVMIDAEESWIQIAIDSIVEELMIKFNKVKPVVYHTLQLYRIDRLFYLKKLVTDAPQQNYSPGFKIVRGAYMEMERLRAIKKEYASPIYPDKESTDSAFNEAMRFCFENIDKLALCIGTHNEESCLEAIQLMKLNNLKNDHERIHFSQLMGMSDHISYNLAQEGYNVSKYVPYGPLRLVMPYLIRRAQENTSVAGQTGRELYLIKKELKRRKNSPSTITT